MKFEQYKNGCFQTTCETIDEVFEAINDVCDPLNKKLFRGHSNEASYKLISTIDRTIDQLEKTFPGKEYKRDIFIKNHLDEFRLRIRGKVDSDTFFDNDIDAWALGQHYGLNTPYLDWTYTPYFAVFFCCISKRNLEKDGCIYALDYNEIKSMNDVVDSNSILKSKYPDKDNEFLKCKKIEVLNNRNTRLITQNGLFTEMPYNISLDDWIESFQHFQKRQVLSKIIIKADIKEELLEFLDKANINYSTVYPDLFGTCTYCNELLETKDTTVNGILMYDKIKPFIKRGK